MCVCVSGDRVRERGGEGRGGREIKRRERDGVGGEVKWRNSITSLVYYEFYFVYERERERERERE